MSLQPLSRALIIDTEGMQDTVFHPVHAEICQDTDHFDAIFARMRRRGEQSKNDSKANAAKPGHTPVADGRQKKPEEKAMSLTYVVAYDGSDASRRAVDYAVNAARGSGGVLLVAYVLEWSPYSFLTPEELDERHKRRGEELARAQQAVIDPLVKELSGAGVTIETAIKYGHVAETLCDIASDRGDAQLFVGRTGHGGVMARVFGSVAGTLAQIAPVPCTIVP